MATRRDPRSSGGARDVGVGRRQQEPRGAQSLQLSSLIALDCQDIARSAVANLPDTVEGVSEAKSRLNGILRVADDLLSSVREQGRQVGVHIPLEDSDRLACNVCYGSYPYDKIWIWSYCRCARYLVCQTCRCNDRPNSCIEDYNCDWCERVEKGERDGVTLESIASCHVMQEGTQADDTAKAKSSESDGDAWKKFLAMMGDAKSIVALAKIDDIPRLVILTRRLKCSVYFLRYDMRPSVSLPVCKECDDTFPGEPKTPSKKRKAEARKICKASMWETCDCGDAMLCNTCVSRIGFRATFSRCYHCYEEYCKSGKCSDTHRGKVVAECCRQEECEAINDTKNRGFHSLLCSSCSSGDDWCECGDWYCPTCVEMDPELNVCSNCGRLLCPDCGDSDREVCSECREGGW